MVIGNPSVETRATARDPLPQHRFTNPVVPSVYTDGVKPNLGYVAAPLHQHPDFSHAANLLIEKWEDKQLSPHANRIDLYSHGKKVAQISPAESKQPLRLDVLVDLDEHRESKDNTWNSFENLILANLALYAGSQERSSVDTAEFDLPLFSTIISTEHFSSQEMFQLLHNWQGQEEIIYTITDKNGATSKRKHGSFDLLDGNDKELRLNITTTERILSVSGTEVARITTRYVPQPGNETTLPADETPLPQPVISAPEVIVTGSTQEERYQHVELIINLLTTYQHEKQHSTKDTDHQIIDTSKETTIFAMPAPVSESTLAAD